MTGSILGTEEHRTDGDQRRNLLLRGYTSLLLGIPLLSPPCSCYSMGTCLSLGRPRMGSPTFQVQKVKGNGAISPDLRGDTTDAMTQR